MIGFIFVPTVLVAVPQGLCYPIPLSCLWPLDKYRGICCNSGICQRLFGHDGSKLAVVSMSHYAFLDQQCDQKKNLYRVRQVKAVDRV